MPSAVFSHNDDVSTEKNAMMYYTVNSTLDSVGFPDDNLCSRIDRMNSSISGRCFLLNVYVDVKKLTAFVEE